MEYGVWGMGMAGRQAGTCKQDGAGYDNHMYTHVVSRSGHMGRIATSSDRRVCWLLQHSF